MTKSLVLPFALAVALAVIGLFVLSGDVRAYFLAGLQVFYSAIAGLKLDWRFDDDEADSLYFLGFLFTIALLAVSFLTPQPGTNALGETLAVVGQGLLLTVLGLFFRQLAVLASQRAPASDSRGALDVAIPFPTLPVTASPPPPQLHQTPPPDSPHFDRGASEATSRALAEIRSATDRFRQTADRITDSQDAIIESAAGMKDSSAQLGASVAEAGKHITGAARAAAQSIAQGAADLRTQLDTEVVKFRSSSETAIAALAEQRELVLVAAETHGNQATEYLTRLQLAAQKAGEVAEAAMAATESSSKLLAERARLLPDPSQPAARYAAALDAAGIAIEASHQVVVEASDAVADSLSFVKETLVAVGTDAEQVVSAERQSLESVRQHFELFRRLENEYVVLVRELLARDRPESPR